MSGVVSNSLEELVNISTIADTAVETSTEDDQDVPKEDYEDAFDYVDGDDYVYEDGPRRCSKCNTMETPLWRNGPQGPKTMCNACGISWKRQKNKAGKKKKPKPKALKGENLSLYKDPFDHGNEGLEKRAKKPKKPKEHVDFSILESGELMDSVGKRRVNRKAMDYEQIVHTGHPRRKNSLNHSPISSDDDYMEYSRSRRREFLKISRELFNKDPEVKKLRREMSHLQEEVRRKDIIIDMLKKYELQSTNASIPEDLLLNWIAMEHLGDDKQ